MLARTTIAQFQPGTADEALSILKDIVLPRAKEQRGFKGALILGDEEHNSAIVVTMWETMDDMLESAPPEDILVDVERLGQLLTEQTTQHTYEVLLQL